ncbi:BQ2448_2473 [Microbotryum intermedium]|uniref:BQ2448_2473 protein n=1 Tax=Microbotryum intermedium TaxID=269621 RepID=A0A238FBR7_9BASI|nr:BQ2448_2473 [Microbotryum intermedium]
MRSRILLWTLLTFASQTPSGQGFLVDNAEFYNSLEKHSINMEGKFTLKSQSTKEYLTITRDPSSNTMNIVTQTHPAAVALQWMSSRATSGQRTGIYAGLMISSFKFCVSSQYGKSKADRGGGNVAAVPYICKKRGDPTIVKGFWLAFDCGSPSDEFVDLVGRLHDHDAQKALNFNWRINNPGHDHRGPLCRGPCARPHRLHRPRQRHRPSPRRSHYHHQLHC